MLCNKCNFKAIISLSIHKVITNHQEGACNYSLGCSEPHQVPFILNGQTFSRITAFQTKFQHSQNYWGQITLCPHHLQFCFSYAALLSTRSHTEALPLWTFPHPHWASSIRLSMGILFQWKFRKPQKARCHPSERMKVGIARDCFT